MPDPLAGIRVVEVADELAAYAGRLLADLGADVVRIVGPGGDPLARREPFVDTPSGPASAYPWFVNHGKRVLELDHTTIEGRQVFAAQLDAADVLLETPRSSLLAEAPELLASVGSGLIHVRISPFGSSGPWSQFAADDLTLLAAGGLLALGGYPDAEPVAVHGDQSLVAASIFGAVATLIALIDRLDDRAGGTVEVSAQEAVIQALEDAIPEYDLTGRVRRRAGDRPREAGSGIFPCADGWVSMIAGRLGTATAWAALVDWLIEAGTPGASELARPPWNEFRYRRTPEAIARFGDVFGAFAASRARADLYVEAQRRSIALSPVNTLEDVLDDIQLEDRGFFGLAQIDALGRPVRFPGRPYRYTPARSGIVDGGVA